MKHLSSIIYHLSFSVAFILVACGGGDDDAAEISHDYLNVTPNLELLAGGQTTDITISANCSWTIEKEGDWLTVSPTSGTGTQTVTVSAPKNTTADVRVAVLRVKGGSLPTRNITVTQLKNTEVEPTPEPEPEPMTLTVDVTSLSYDKAGGTKSFIISSNTSWTISAPQWCSLSTTRGQGQATITATVGANPLTEERTGQIVVSGEGTDPVTINVSQQPAEAVSHEPNEGDNLPPS